MENIFIKTLTLDDLTKVDFNSSWHPHELLAALQNAAQCHSILLGCGYYVLRKKNLAWVLCRTLIEINCLPKLGETASVKTWPGAPQKFLYPRYYAVENEKGEELVKASSIWILLDLDSRKVKDPGSLSIYDEHFTFLPPNMPLPEKLRLTGQFTGEVWRTPQYSEIDANKHLNNAHYLKWICDLFDYRRYRFNQLASVQINYIKEIPPAAPVHITWETTNESTDVLSTSSEGATYFEAKIRWK
ncbi:MAG: acyl-[acyl-carrier-protein] thioesterase [Christensenellales bacterium]